MQRFFITATGTNIGKTLVMQTLCHQWQQQGKNVQAVKPVMSGYHPDEPNDLLAISAVTGQLEDALACYRFAAPLSPDMAARQEQVEISMERLVEFCQPANDIDIQLIEGVGGVMVPLTENQTVCDWIEKLNIPVILVTGSYLGTLSHTLTAIEVIRQRNLDLAGVIVNSSAGEDNPPLDETIITLKNFINVPMISLPYKNGELAYKNMPKIISTVSTWGK